MKLGGNPNGKLPSLDPDCRVLVQGKKCTNICILYFHNTCFSVLMIFKYESNTSETDTKLYLN